MAKQSPKDTVIGLVVIAAAAYFWFNYKSANEVASPTAQTATTAQDIPDDQKAFVAAIAASRDAYDKAPNDLLKSAERKVRAKALCELISSGKVKGWVGKIYKLTTNGDGNGVLSIELDGDIWIGTYNNSLSDIGSDTLIPSDSELFTSLTKMKEAQQVTFSGAFFRDVKTNLDCLTEKSLSEAGTMSQPEFLFNFVEVEPLK